MTGSTAHQPTPWTKYRPCPTVDLPDRRWPSRTITRAPRWCSVDLRDGNQALAQPMSVGEKLEFFRLLAAVGFREIEVGFPAASQVEFDFTRRLIDEGLVPEAVAIQVLTQAREPLIRRTFEALRGARRAILHLYNSTSTLQRRVVFGMSRREVIELAVAATRLAREEAQRLDGTEVILEYSPESFTGTEPEFALEICEAVLEAWGATAARPAILNLPATVEMSTPNVYADRIEWFLRRLSRPGAGDPQRARPQRPRHRRGGHRTGAARRGGARRGDAVRQRRAHRQRRHPDARAQPADAGRRPRARLLGHRPRRRGLRALHPPAGAPAPPVRRGAGAHRLLRLAPGRHQQGAAGARARAAGALGGAVPADRPGGHRPHLRGGDPHQQPVRQGGRGLGARAGARVRAAQGDAPGVRRARAAALRGRRRRALPGGDPRRRSSGSTSAGRSRSSWCAGASRTSRPADAGGASRARVLATVGDRRRAARGAAAPATARSTPSAPRCAPPAIADFSLLALPRARARVAARGRARWPTSRSRPPGASGSSASASTPTSPRRRSGRFSAPSTGSRPRRPRPGSERAGSA